MSRSLSIEPAYHAEGMVAKTLGIIVLEFGRHITAKTFGFLDSLHSLMRNSTASNNHKLIWVDP
ncbi:MAG: hypothetical protein NTU84_00410 [Verrucomicrobia bacterium]|nr:hypothetical protein [Verrucomicrobiota bacterium]